MENLKEKWERLSNRIALDISRGRKPKLSFAEVETIIKPYSIMTIGNTSCKIRVGRFITVLGSPKENCFVEYNLNEVVYGM